MADTKPFVADCPHCQAKVRVDPVTRKLSKHTSGRKGRMADDEADDLFGQAMGKIKHLADHGDEIFGDAQSKVSSRDEKALDAFEKAKKKIAEDNGDVDRGNLIHPFHD